MRRRKLRQCVRERTNVGVPIVRAFLQTLGDDRGEPVRKIGALLQDRRRVGDEHRGADLRKRVSVERWRAREELVEDDSERPDVGARVDVARRRELLGRHVERRSHEVARARELLLDAVDAHLRDPEVDDLHDARRILAPREKQVRWLQITMNDPRGVRLGEPCATLENVVDGIADREGAARLEHLPEVFPFEVLHDHERRARVERPDVGHVHDVVAAELCGRTRLASETLDGGLVRCRGGQHELQRDTLVELDVHGLDDYTHPSHAEHALDAVFPGEYLADLHRRSRFVIQEGSSRARVHHAVMQTPGSATAPWFHHRSRRVAREPASHVATCHAAHPLVCDIHRRRAREDAGPRFATKRGRNVNPPFNGGKTMNWAQVEGKWEQLVGDVKSTWGKLTDDDIKVVAGKRDLLVGKLHERYGTAKEQAHKDIDAWVTKIGAKIDHIGDSSKKS